LLSRIFFPFFYSYASSEIYMGTKPDLIIRQLTFLYGSEAKLGVQHFTFFIWEQSQAWCPTSYIFYMGAKPSLDV
jgi:hypothetical protein